MKMDFSKFKKIKSDDKTTTLQHPDGHEIKIAHSALSVKMKNEISKIPQALADGGKVGENSSPDQDDSSPPPVNININSGPQPQSPSQVPTQQTGQDNSQLFNNVKDAYADQSNQVPQTGGASASWDDSPQGTAGRSPAGQTSMGQSGNQQAIPGQNISDQYLQNYQKSLREQKAGIYGQANAEGQEGKEIAQASQNNQDAMAHIQAEHDAKYFELNREREAVQQDINNSHINPSQYQENLSSGQKVKNAIGLILGGMGAGLTHSENPALQFINAQIERDIAAQQNEMGKKQNLLKANMEQFGNLREATNMTRAMQNDIYSSQLKQAAGKSMDPVAKARALTAAGQLDAQSATITSQLAMSQIQRQNTMNLQNGNSQNVNPELIDPKMRERIVPLPTGGQGLAYSSKEAEEVKNSFTNLSNLKDNIQKMRQFQQDVGTTVPFSDNDQVAKDMRSSMILTLNQLHDLKRLNDHEFIENKNMIPDVGAIRQGKVSAQLDNLERMINTKMGEEYKNHIEGMNNKLPSSFTPPSQLKVGPPKIKGQNG